MSVPVPPAPDVVFGLDAGASPPAPPAPPPPPDPAPSAPGEAIVLPCHP